MIGIVWDLQSIPDPATFGTIAIEVTAGSIAARHYIGVSGPTGAIKSITATPDGIGEYIFLRVSIPTNQDGELIQGEYVFTVRVEDLDDEDYVTIVDEQETFVFCDYRQSFDLLVKSDCYSKSLVIQDNTQYDAGHEVSRDIIVQHPLIPGEDPVPNTTYSNSSADYPIPINLPFGDAIVVSLVRSSGRAYHNVIYGIYTAIGGNTGAIVQGEMTFRVAYTNELSVTHLVRCSLDACDIIACVDKKMKELIQAACSQGGLGKATPLTQDVFQLLNGYLTMYQYWVQCKNQTSAQYYYDKIKGLLGDCSCGDPVGPQIIPESDFIYLRGWSAYELWILDGNVGTLQDFYLFLSRFYPPFDPWVEITSVSMANDYDPDGTDPLSWRTDGRFIYFDGKFGAGDWPTAGETFMAASYWTGLGIALQPGSATDIMETSGAAQGLRIGSLVVAPDGSIEVWGTGLNIGVEAIVTGILVRND